MAYDIKSKLKGCMVIGYSSGLTVEVIVKDVIMDQGRTVTALVTDEDRVINWSNVCYAIPCSKLRESNAESM